MRGIRSEIDFRIFGNGWGCGFCGTVGPPAPECCGKGREWVRRFMALVHTPQMERAVGPESHNLYRWQRVVRRWEHKRVG